MKNWKKIKLGEIITESRIESLEPDSQRRIRVKLNVGGVEKRPDTNDIEGATKYFKRKSGQFIYGQQNLHKGAFGIVPLELDGFESSSDIPAFDVDDSCYPEWILYFFKQGNFYLKLEPLAKGVGSKRIYPKQLYDLVISVPTKEEQKKVLDSIHNFELTLRKLTNEVTHQLSLTKKLKESILQEAISGKLSMTWRSNENHDLVSSAIASDEYKPLYKNIPAIKKNEIPFDIPKSWIWRRLGEVIELISGQHIDTTNYNDKGNGVPYLTGPSDFGPINPIFTKWSTKPKVLAKKGDILITVKGSGVGKLNILHEDNVAIGRQLMAIRSTKLDMEYVHLFLDSNYSVLQSQKIGVAIPGISRDDILLKLIPVPPVAEQQFIVNKARNLNRISSQMEKRANDCIHEADLLLQSYLNEIFGDDNMDLLSELNSGNKANAERKLKEFPVEVNSTNYNINFLTMELVELLKENGKMTAIDLWKLSKYAKDIDAFYGELKKQVEEEKTIQESKEKGYLELTK